MCLMDCVCSVATGAAEQEFLDFAKSVVLW